jgi:YidC/Oxa1 family membrane protein insertase
MEKRLAVAIALTALVLLAWPYLFPPPEPLPAPAWPASPEVGERRDEATPESEAPGATTTAAPAEPPPVLEPVEASAEEELVVENGEYEVRLSNRGGRAVSWKLRGFTTPDGMPLEVVPRYADGESRMLAVDLDDAALADAFNTALYRVERSEALAEDGRPAGQVVTFLWSDGHGLEARKSLTFRHGEYLVDVDLELVDRGRPLSARLALGPGFAAQEHREGRSNYYYWSQAIWNVAGRVSRTGRGKLSEGETVRGPLRWAGLEDQFFAALILPGGEATDLRWKQLELTPAEPHAEPPEPLLEPLLSLALPSGRAQVYVGPKQYSVLQGLGHDLEQAVWFSSQPWLAWVVRQIYFGLLWIHDRTVPNYGVAIILATFVLRLLLFPVNQYSMLSMKKSQLEMQRLQPKVKSIRNKYKKLKDVQSRQKMNEEMMALYKREGVNPMAGLTGCLPLLAQFPILIGFYNMLTVAVELRGAPFFGWIQDLSVKDPYWITPLLMGATMFLQQRMSMTKIKDPQQLQQQRIMMFMPVMFTFICLQMPSGLVLYWLVNNVLGMGQQWLVNRHAERLNPAAQKA